MDSEEVDLGNKSPEKNMTEEIKVKLIKTSINPQTKELKDYLNSVISACPYNKFCVDCHKG